MAKLGDRIVVLIDMDCFFCQVEAKLNPSLKGKPLAVVQYSSFGPGSIIAVNYEARDFGVTRHMKGAEAKEKCPNIVLVKVPPLRNKPDTSRYRNAGRDVIDVLKKYCAVIERASVDEAYLDITDLVDEKLKSMTISTKGILKKLSNSFVVGYCDDESNDEEKRSEGIERWVEEAFDELGDIQARKLAIAGLIVEEFRSEIYAQCEYRCSAGISYNKILAKLACGIHKPNRQTILPTAAVPGLYSSLPVKKVRNLGGKFGNIVMESLGCNVMADLLRFSIQELQKRFDEKTGLWLWNIARGIDNEPVTSRLICKSIGASKNFPGKQAITKLDVLKQWLGELAAELVDRLEQDMEENQRRAVAIIVSYSYYQDKKVISQSRTCPLTSYKVERITNLCVEIITRSTQKPISFLSMSAGKFVPIKDNGCFANFFKAGTSKQEDNENKVASVELQEKDTVSTKIKEIETINTSNSDDSSDDSQDSMINCNRANPKTDVRKEPQKIDLVSKKSKANDSVLLKKREETVTNPIDSPKSNNKTSNSSINFNLRKPIDPESFKTSFFMNLLKESNPHLLPLNYIKQTEKPLDKSNLDTRKNSNFSNQEVRESPDLFDGCTPETDDEEDSQDEIRNTKSTNDNRNVKQNSESCKQQSALDQLKEIFPDLDNIDSAVLQLLPFELQREAKNFVKSTKTSPKVSIVTKTNTKNGTKGKTKSKTVTTPKKKKLQTNSIQNFFMKNVSNTSNDSEMQKCDECGQMISIKKYVEHCDYHVAINLQRLINQTNNQEESSRSSATDSPENSDSNSAKRKYNIEPPKPTKKARSIESFTQ